MVCFLFLYLDYLKDFIYTVWVSSRVFYKTVRQVQCTITKHDETKTRPLEVNTEKVKCTNT